MEQFGFDIDSFFATSQEIKREDWETPEVCSTPEDETTTKRKGAKRTHDPVEVDKRTVRRKENQKVACRNYRMRKKEHLSELKDRIQQLEAEKEQLTRENLSHKMNSIPSSNSAVDPTIVASFSEFSRSLTELENSLIVNAEDRVVEYLLKLFFTAAGKLHTAFIKDVDELVNPFAQVRLASLGYMPSMEYSEVGNLQAGGWWETFTSSVNLTLDQSTKLQLIINNIIKRDCELRMERGNLDKQIKQFCTHKLMILPLLANPSKPIEQLDAKTILDFTWLLNRLKTNIITQKSLLLSSQSQISEILTPRQHASLVTLVCKTRFFEWPYHAQILRSAWNFINANETAALAQQHPFAPLSPPLSPSSQSPYSSPPFSSSPPQYFTQPPSPPTVVPSIAIPTPAPPFPTYQGFTFVPVGSPSLTSTCTNAQAVPTFVTSLNYGVH